MAATQALAIIHLKSTIWSRQRQYKFGCPNLCIKHEWNLIGRRGWGMSSSLVQTCSRLVKNGANE